MLRRHTAPSLLPEDIISTPKDTLKETTRADCWMNDGIDQAAANSGSIIDSGSIN